jgi:hypothetical protein
MDALRHNLPRSSNSGAAGSPWSADPVVGRRRDGPAPQQTQSRRVTAALVMTFVGFVSADSHRDHMLVEPSFAPEQFWI